MGNMCTFGRVRKPHGHVQADARSTRMGANRAGASAGRGGQAAAVERAGSVSASAGRGERTSAGGGGGGRRRRAGAPECLGGAFGLAAAVGRAVAAPRADTTCAAGETQSSSPQRHLRLAKQVSFAMLAGSKRTGKRKQIEADNLSITHVDQLVGMRRPI